MRLLHKFDNGLNEKIYLFLNILSSPVKLDWYYLHLHYENK